MGVLGASTSRGYPYADMLSSAVTVWGCWERQHDDCTHPPTGMTREEEFQATTSAPRNALLCNYIYHLATLLPSWGTLLAWNAVHICLVVLHRRLIFNLWCSWFWMTLDVQGCGN